MNRQQMAEEIANRVPQLAEWDEEVWLDGEKLRSNFVRDYTTETISGMSLDDYVIGKGAENRSFCYRLEREMDTLGKIVGSTAQKFGIYYGRIKSDPTVRYRFAKRWGTNADEAFESVKRAIVELIRAAAVGDHDAITRNRLSPMFKGKILFVYNPEKYAPIYSKDHLEHFIAKLDLRGPFRGEAEMQRALMEYRTTWPELLAQPPALYMRLLYQIFGKPPNGDSSDSSGTDSSNEPILDEAVAGAQFIAEMPSVPARPPTAAKNKGKTDYEMQERRSKRIGDRGEALVVALEIIRLTRAGKPDLAGRLKRVSQETDDAGFDVQSYDEDGTSRPIEVKATTGENLERGFYITKNEVEKAGKLPNYHLYIVFSAMSRQPRILPIKSPDFNGAYFQLEALTYRATLSAQEGA